MGAKELKERKARDKAAGISRTYPEHADGPQLARALPVLPCAHGGTDADIVERCPSCSGGGRHVRECAVHGTCTRDPVNPAVMDCGRCRRERLGYTPEGWLTIPQPPPLKLTPTRPRAVVTVVVGPDAAALYELTGPLYRAYAGRIDADPVVLDWRGHRNWPMSSKFGIARVLDHYEQLAFVDVDVAIPRRAVDLFSLCSPDEFGAVDELPHRTKRQRAEYERFRTDMGRPQCAIPWYVNTGVMVVPRSHRALLLPPAGPMPTHHCAEQDWISAGLLDSGLPYRLLDRRANWQHWTDVAFRAAPADALLHVNGMSKAERMRVLRDLVASAGAIGPA